MYRAAFLLVLSPLLAQKDEPRSKAADYPVHVSVPGMEIAAEYLLHSIPTTHGFYVANLYLVVDVGVFPSSGETVKVSNGQFRLRVNHGKFDLIADTPGTVAGSLKYPDWEQQRNLSAQAGPVIIGAPPNVGRFPGDGRDHPPVSAPVPEEPDPSGQEKQVPQTMDELINAAALPEWPSKKPLKGCVFFHFAGKMKSIHSLELLYDGGAGRPKATIPLF